MQLEAKRGRCLGIEVLKVVWSRPILGSATKGIKSDLVEYS
jgi:hypothetical protein